ncbi:MAG: formate/nitrite transporter family protein [Clostridia bacterium]|nr:formate/nitrite transporter family protein [Clostridia bacterium]
MLEKFIKSIYGGFMIACGGTVYLSCDNKYIGALLFALGLFTICEFGFGLFTGKVGYTLFNKPIYIIELVLTILGNFVGCFVIGKAVAYVKPALYEKGVSVCAAKLAETPLENFILACMCGVMMYIAVEMFKTKSGAAKHLGIFLAVPVFILCGFEHSIANMYYFALGGAGAVDFLSFTVVTILGNAVGAIVFSLYKFYKAK